MNIGKYFIKRGLPVLVTAVWTILAFSVLPPAAADDDTPTPPPQVTISSVPLGVVKPATPEVMFALTNSMSMDSSDDIIDDANSDLSLPAGTTHARAPSSAIMTWSGAQSDWNQGAPSSSPVNYTVPAGFTAPISDTAAGAQAPYTKSLGTNTWDTPQDGYYSSASWLCAKYISVDVSSTRNGISAPTWPAGTKLKPSSYPPEEGFTIPAPSTPAWPTSETWNTWGPDGTYTNPANSPLVVRYWYNGITGGIDDTGYYKQLEPPALNTVASAQEIPSARQWFHSTADLWAATNNGGLRPAGMGVNTPPRVIPNAIGTTPVGPTTPACGPGSDPHVDCMKNICVLYVYNPPQWHPATTVTTTYAPYGDNSPSRLNIAKASIAQVITNYSTQVNFGLMTYNVPSAAQSYYSLVYYMSTAGGFTSDDFSSQYHAPTYAAPEDGAPGVMTSHWVNNPCYGSAAANNGCTTIIPILNAQIGINISNYPFVQVANSSDDPQVNDVILTPNTTYTFLLGDKDSTHVRTPDSPYPPSPPGFTLGDYNTGTTVSINYPGVWPSQGGDGTYNMAPTNSGFVPYSDQVIASLRGKPWTGAPTAGTGNIVVSVTTTPAQEGFAVDGTTTLKQVYLQKFTPYLTPENIVRSNDPTIVPGVSPTITFGNYYGKAIEASALQSPIAGLMHTALIASNWPPQVANAFGCIPPRYVVLITDGLPTEDMQGKNWPPPGSASATGYGATVAFNGDGTLNAAGTNNKAVSEAIDQISQLNQQGIKTFVVGMGPGVNPSLNPTAAKVLTAMAKAGGTQEYFPGTNPAAVVQQLETILNIINHLDVAGAAAALNSTGLNHDTVSYQSTYTAYAKPENDWTGDLQAFSVAVDNGRPATTATWSAQCQLDKLATGISDCNSSTTLGTGTGWRDSRVIATWNPVGGSGSGAGVPFEWPTAVGPDTINATQESDLIGADTVADIGKERLDYLRGDTSNDEANGGSFRNRSHILGDIVDSQPIYIAAPGGPYDGMPGYNQFVSDYKNRTPMLYVGANDGMLHAFNASTGKELFAFIPNGVFKNLIKLTSPNYNGNHQFFVDGSPSAADVRFANDSWHTILVGGLNDGGNSIYALDVTKPKAIADASSQSDKEAKLAQDVLWEFTDPHLGLTYSRPAITLTNDTSTENPAGFLVFFGSGYNNDDGDDYLYAVNPQTGALVKRINLCTAVDPDPCSTALANGLSGVTAVNNNGLIGAPATTIYAGDLQGHLWKVDISPADPADWKVTLLFSAADKDGKPQPITDTPVVSLNPQYPGSTGTVVYFGTGQYLSRDDITSEGTQSFYGVLDNGAAYTPHECYGKAQHSMTRCDLVEQDISDGVYSSNGSNLTVRTVTSNHVDWNADKGWYIDLETGERVVTDPQLYSGKVVFTTYTPAPAETDSCTIGGQSYLMVLNYATGGAFDKPQLDLNNDGMLNDEDQAGNKNVVGVSMGSVFASMPNILSASYANKDVHGLNLVTGSGLNQYGSYGTPRFGYGGSPAKITWTQLTGG